MFPGLIVSPKRSWMTIRDGYKARREMIQQRGTFL